MPLDEKALRRPEFRPGRAVILADGQAWTFRLPVVKFKRDPEEGPEGFTVHLDPDGADEFSALLEAFHGAVYRDEQRVAEYKLARAMLLANYDLAFAEFASLVQFAVDGDDSFPEGRFIEEQVRAIATGSNGPRVLGRWRRVVAIVTGMLPVQDGLLLEDWIDACAVVNPPPSLNPNKWIDELNFRLAYESTANMA